MSDEAWSLITSLIADLEVRYITLEKTRAHAFFTNPSDGSDPITDFDRIQSPGKGARVPHVPRLNGELDTSYFDDFDNVDMDLYKEIFATKGKNEVQSSSEVGSSGVRGGFVGFTFKQK